MKKGLKDIFVDHYIIFCVYALIGWIYEVSWYLIAENRFVNRGVLFGPFLPIYGFGVLILLFLLRNFMSKKHNISHVGYLSISLFTITTFVVTTIIEYSTPKIYRVDYFLGKYGLLLLFINLIVIVSVSLFVYFSKSKKVKNIDVTIVMVFLLIWIITTFIEYVSHYAIDKYTHKMLWDYSRDFLNINKRVNWDASRNFAIGGTLLLYTVQPLLDRFLNYCRKNIKYIIVLVLGIPMLIDFIVNVILK